MLESILKFAQANVSEEEIRGRTVLEAGSRAIGGPRQSVRPVLQTHAPARYVGTDIEAGLYVDEICDAGELVARFGAESFDVVVSTEMLEHVRDWRAVVSNLKQVVKRGGVLLVTTPSHGFPYHAHPHDFWRYEVDDMRAMFADFEIETLEANLEAPGILMKARKPVDFHERDLSGFALFSMVKQRRVKDISRRDERIFLLAYTPVTTHAAQAQTRREAHPAVS